MTFEILITVASLPNCTKLIKYLKIRLATRSNFIKKFKQSMPKNKSKDKI